MKKGSKLSDLALKASIVYLGLHVIDSLCYRAWGGFLILATIATVGWSFMLAAVAYFLFGFGYDAGTVLVIGAVLGWLTALKSCSDIYRKRTKKRSRRSR
jgi:hypothetical protein